MNSSTFPLHGGEALALVAKLGLSVDDYLDFSSNTFFSAFDLTKKLAKNVEVELGHYPDPENYLLSSVLADYESVGIENILATNGSAELIHLIFLALKPKKVLLIGPVFSEYPRACNIFGVDFEVYTPPESQNFELLDDDLRRIKCFSADLMIICSPNNPAGVAYDNLSTLIASVNAKYVLWDASYKDFLYGQALFEEYAKTIQSAVFSSKLLCLCSLTKFFACPGLRLGYLVANQDLVQLIRQVQNFWAVGAHASAIGQVLVKHVDSYRERLSTLNQERTYMHETLTQTGAFSNFLLGVSFITAKLNENIFSNKSDALDLSAYIKNSLLEKKIIVRVCDNILGMPANYLRMQVRDKEATSKLKRSIWQLLI